MANILRLTEAENHPSQIRHPQTYELDPCQSAKLFKFEKKARKRATYFVRPKSQKYRLSYAISNFTQTTNKVELQMWRQN